MKPNVNFLTQLARAIETAMPLSSRNVEQMKLKALQDGRDAMLAAIDLKHQTGDISQALALVRSHGLSLADFNRLIDKQRKRIAAAPSRADWLKLKAEKDDNYEKQKVISDRWELAGKHGMAGSRGGKRLLPKSLLRRMQSDNT